MKKTYLLLPAFLAVLFLGASCTKTATTNGNVNTNAVARNYAVTYAGQDGKSALELLQQNHQVEASAEGFVNAIDGQKPGDRVYWAFYINDQLANTGAKDLITKNGDQIGWILESF